MENEIDRRAYKRFEMKLPATIIQETSGVNGHKFHLLLTRDISHNGAYFNTMKPCSYKGPLQVEILIDMSGECNRCFLYMMTSAEVVRCDDSGMAVIFDEDFMLAPFHIR